MNVTNTPKVRNKKSKLFFILVSAVAVAVIINVVVVLYLYDGFNIGRNIFSGPAHPTKLVKLGAKLRYLEAVSFYPGYDFQLQNREEIIKLLESWFIYGRTNVNMGTQSTLDTPLTTIQFTIRDRRPGGWKPTYGDNVYLLLSPGFLELTFYLTREKMVKPDVSDYILKEFLKDVYLAVYPSTTPDKLANIVQDGFDTLKLKNKNYIVITKQ